MGATSEHFSDVELRCHGNDCGQLGCPINASVQELVDALEEFRSKIGAPVIIDSGFRCAFHNGSIAVAVQHSQHVLGRAADIRVEGMTAAQLEAIAHTIMSIRGIGRDDFANYIHIDVRAQDVLSLWCYDKSGAEIPYYPPGVIPT